MENRSSTRIAGMLGFAMRAGRVMVGTDIALTSLRRPGLVKLVLLSATASEGTLLRVSRKCEFYKTPCLRLGIGSEELGRLLGKTYAPAVVAVTDDGFAREIMKAAADTTPTDDGGDMITEKGVSERKR